MFKFNQRTSNIIAVLTPAEAEIIESALPFLKWELQQDPANKHICNRIIEMRTELGDEILKAKTVDPQFIKSIEDMIANRKPVLPMSGEAKLRQRFRDLLNPPFTTEDFQTAMVRCCDSFEMGSMQFEKKGYPSKVEGTVTTGRSTIAVKWDRNGKCYTPFGVAKPECNLIRQSEKEIQSAKAVGESMLLALIVIIVCAIF